MSALRDVAPDVRGRVRLWTKRAGVWVPRAVIQNQIQYSWGMIAAQAMGRGDASYAIHGMYIEFENVASPGDAVTIPTYGRDEGVEYYDDLVSSSVRDFLRVALLQDPLLGVEAGYENYFGDGEGNKLTFFAQSQGTTGIHGKTFSDTVNSKVFGAALVATPVFSDRTQDIVFARSYFAVDEQTVKEASSQVGISWEISFL